MSTLRTALLALALATPATGRAYADDAAPTPSAGPPADGPSPLQTVIGSSGPLKAVTGAVNVVKSLVDGDASPATPDGSPVAKPESSGPLNKVVEGASTVQNLAEAVAPLAEIAGAGGAVKAVAGIAATVKSLASGDAPTEAPSTSNKPLQAVTGVLGQVKSLITGDSPGSSDGPGKGATPEAPPPSSDGEDTDSDELDQMMLQQMQMMLRQMEKMAE